jgi:hypothetical protein
MRILMSRVQRTLHALGIAFALPALTGAVSTSLLHAASVPATGASALSGAWQSAPDETPLSSAFDQSVWGKNAVAIRTVQMTIGPTGDATLTVRRKVIDGRRHTVHGSSSVEQIQLSLGPVQRSTDVRSDLAVSVKQAERRYPDDPRSTWPIEGLRVGVSTFPDDPARLEIRVDTAEGPGSFWETLRRATNKKPSPTHQRGDGSRHLPDRPAGTADGAGR